jgi:hypothetical protein
MRAGEPAADALEAGACGTGAFIDNHSSKAIQRAIGPPRTNCERRKMRGRLLGEGLKGVKSKSKDH